MPYVTQAKEVKSDNVVLMTYFRKAGQSASEFFAEIKALDEESRKELTAGAAKELGWTAV